MDVTNLAKRMNYFWNHTSPRMAHLGISGERQEMLDRYKTLIVDKRIRVEGKTLIDFGCGGGLLGVYLCENTKIKKYIAYDLAERSIDVAKENLFEHKDKTEFIHLTRHVWNFAEHKADILVCLACIIHFPIKTYLDNFLSTCNESGCKYLVLEIRDIGKGTQFRAEPFKSVRETSLACVTNEEYVTSKLTNYKLVDKTNAEDAPTNCQVLWYKKNA